PAAAWARRTCRASGASRARGPPGARRASCRHLRARLSAMARPVLRVPVFLGRPRLLGLSGLGTVLVGPARAGEVRAGAGAGAPEGLAAWHGGVRRRPPRRRGGRLRRAVPAAAAPPGPVPPRALSRGHGAVVAGRAPHARHDTRHRARDGAAARRSGGAGAAGAPAVGPASRTASGSGTR